MRFVSLVFLFSCCLPALAASDSRSTPLALEPLFDVMVRQEILDGVYYFAPDPDRNWVRFRTRAGAAAETGDHAFRLLLTNEHRRYVHPSDIPFDWDEVILDQASWAWSPSPGATLTLGRQNVIWDKGFLMLEGHPLDGSRSIYQNALRVQVPAGDADLDLMLIHNPKRDPIVIAGDQERALTDADETAAAARLAHGTYRWSLIWKNEVDPDHRLPHLQVLTLGGRTDRSWNDSAQLVVEAALQYQRESAADGGRPDGFAFALQAHLEDDLGTAWRGKAGIFHYSGNAGDLRAFRTPWGRWPKWSELYIYTLIGESVPGRVNVAAWEDIAGPYVTLLRPVAGIFSLRLSAYYLVAPQTDWAGRGALTQAEVKCDLLPGLAGHLLWEMLVPGDFHDGRGGLEPLTGNVHFLRWQFSYTL
jgi:hypothetical protein